MSHQQIIQTLIEWIDDHIDQPLNIDVVAKKSGYSKWYLQRMFRTVMHQTLGEYIRQRRLLLAAQGLGLLQHRAGLTAVHHPQAAPLAADALPALLPAGFLAAVLGALLLFEAYFIGPVSWVLSEFLL